MDKESLRRKFIDLRNKLKKKDLDSNSEIIKHTILNSQLYKNSKNIFTYISFGNEVDTRNLIRQFVEDKKDVYVPGFTPNNKLIICQYSEELVVGRYEVLQPKKIIISEIKDYDMIIIPGVAFDINCNRLGFGIGYYDQMLKTITGKKIGICHDFQIVENLPIQKHDVRVDILISEKMEIGR